MPRYSPTAPHIIPHSALAGFKIIFVQASYSAHQMRNFGGAIIRGLTHSIILPSLPSMAFCVFTCRCRRPRKRKLINYGTSSPTRLFQLQILRPSRVHLTVGKITASPLQVDFWGVCTYYPVDFGVVFLSSLDGRYRSVATIFSFLDQIPRDYWPLDRYTPVYRSAPTRLTRSRLIAIDTFIWSLDTSGHRTPFSPQFMDKYHS